jgi:transposase
VLLAASPTPEQAAKLTRPQLRTLLKRAGRKNTIDAEAERLHVALRASQMRQLPLAEQAMGRQTIALLRQLDATCISADELAEAADAAFSSHPDAPIINSFPGIGKLTGARVFAEIGDDRSRFRDARGLKAYAGGAPVTRASGKRSTVLARRIKNQRLAGVGYVWAFAATAHSDGARAHYDRRRDASDRHTAAQRNLFNRLIGCLHHCLTQRVLYDEATAFPITPEPSLNRTA